MNLIMRIALTGDVMLGRLMDRYIIQAWDFPPSGIWGDVLPLLLSADLRLVNLECVIATRGEMWRPHTKPFHFRAHPRAIEFLQAARVNCVTLANNHVLDYGEEALEECIRLLDQAGIPHAGAGRNLAEALEPALLTAGTDRVAVLALTDNEPEWEATDSNPGTNFIDYDAHGLIEPYRSRVRGAIAHARSRADLVIVSAHVGRNWGKPSPAMQALAHELLDMGAGLYWGHSNHTPQGIELYNAKPILYSTGDFVDDYAVDDTERNDLSFLFVAEAQEGRICSITLHPTAIDRFQVRRAGAEEAAFLQTRITSLSADFGTRLTPAGDQIACEITSPDP